MGWGEGEPKLGSTSKGGLGGGEGGSGELIVAKSNTSLGERKDKEDREPKLGPAWKGGLGEGGVR